MRREKRQCHGGGEAESRDGEERFGRETKSFLQNQTLLPSLSVLLREQSRASGVFEDFADALVGLGRALEIFVGTDLLADLLSLFVE